MNDGRIILSREIIVEKKKLGEGLRRLVRELTEGDSAKILFNALGPHTFEVIHAELDRLSQSIERVGDLSRTLIDGLRSDKNTNLAPLIKEASQSIEMVAASLQKSVRIAHGDIEFSVDRSMVEAFSPILREMLEMLVEYCIEPAKERTARGKNVKAFFQFEVKRTENALRLRVACDGNGVIPPISPLNGAKLAQASIRAVFEGRPGKWSAWIFHLPLPAEEFRCLRVRVASREVFIPMWAIGENRSSSSGELSDQECWSLGESVTLFKTPEKKRSVTVSAGFESRNFAFDEVLGESETLMIPLDPKLDGGGRFLGVVSEEARAQELFLVVNPAYLVYGGRDST